MTNFQEAYNLVKDKKYDYLGRVEMKGTPITFYALYAKTQGGERRAVIISTRQTVLLKEYSLYSNSAHEKVLLEELEEIVKKYHLLEEELMQNQSRVYRTIGCIGGIALGTVLPVPFLEEVLLGTAGYLMGRVFDEKSNNARHTLTEYLHREHVLCDNVAIDILRKE